MKLTKTAVEKLNITGVRYEARDDDIKGFVVRVGATGDKAFYFVYRAGKGRGSPLKRLHLGRFPTMTVEQARHLAKEKAASVALGADPAHEVKAGKTAPIMSSMLQSFMEEHFPKIKRNTVKSYRTNINAHIIPAMGKMRVQDVVYSDIAKLHHSMKHVPYAANRCLRVLSTFFTWCELHGYRERRTNPCQDVKKYKEYKRFEFMSMTELAILGNVLDKMEQNWHERRNVRERRDPSTPKDTITPHAAAAIRLLMLTGARVGEILSLEWSRIDFEQGLARLPDSKTGFKVLQLPAPALAVLENLPKISKWVFPSWSTEEHMLNLAHAWEVVRQQAGLIGWRLHDLRHAFASMMVNNGASLPTIAKILGHTAVSTTQRYAHLEQNPARKAAEDAAAKIAQAWASKPEYKEDKLIEFPKAQ